MEQNDGTAEFTEMGAMEGHNGWVTAIIAGYSQKEGEDSAVLVSGSRDKTIMIWNLNEKPAPGETYGRPKKSLTGHNHFVSDLALSFDNHYLLSSSWDKTIRLWDLRTGLTVKRFVGHTKEIFTISFSPDNRQVISAGADKQIKLWNTLGENKFSSEQNNHTDWVSCVRYSPQLKQQSKVTFQPYFASVGWDGKLKIWNTNFQIRFSFKPHEGQINSVAISPNGKYLATGGKDKKLQIWDIADLNEPIREIDCNGTIHKISFNPKYQWVGCATDNGIEVWDLMNEVEKPL